MCSRLIAQRREFLDRLMLIRQQLLAKGGKVFRYALAPIIAGHELSDLRTLLEQQSGQARNARRLRLPQALGHETRRDIDAVQDIADVVQHIGGDFGHSRLARGRHQLLVRALELHILSLALRRVLNHRHRAQGLAVRSGQPAGVRGCGARRRRVARRDHEFDVVDGLAAQRPGQWPLLPRHRSEAVRKKQIRLERIRIRCGWLLRSNAIQVHRGTIVVSDVPRRIAGQQRERQFADHRLEQRLLLEQCRRELLALGNVPQVFDRVRRAAAFVHERRGGAHPKIAAILAAVALLDVDEWDFTVPQSLELRLGEHDVLGMRQFRGRVGREFLRGESEQSAECLVEAKECAVAVRIGDSDRSLIEGIAE